MSYKYSPYNSAWKSVIHESRVSSLGVGLFLCSPGTYCLVDSEMSSVLFLFLLVKHFYWKDNQSKNLKYRTFINQVNIFRVTVLDFSPLSLSFNIVLFIMTGHVIDAAT